MNASLKNKQPKIDVSFDCEIDGTYVVSVTIDDTTFDVNCQTGFNHDYQETYSLTCCNESGGDIYDSGLVEYLKGYNIDNGDELFSLICDRITECAEAHRPENSIERILNETGDETYKYDNSLFGAFGPTNVHHHKYQNESGQIIVTSEDSTQPLAENALLGQKHFDNENAFEEWIDEIYDNDGHYGDCSVSYRAWQDITGKQ